MKKLLIIAALAIPGTALAQTSPFGIVKGTSIQELLNMGGKSSGDGFYALPKVPKPNSAFAEYHVIATKGQGVCKIIASSSDFENDSSGFKIKRTFGELESTLVSIYGQGQKYDFNKSSSIWKESDDWMMALKTEDRTLSIFWVEKAKLPAPLAAIGLRARGLSSSKGFINLNYEFDNFDACAKEIKGSPTDGL